MPSRSCPPLSPAPDACTSLSRLAGRAPNLRNRSPILTPAMHQATSGADRRAQPGEGQSQTNRRLLLRVASGVLVVASVVALAGCGGGGDDKQGKPAASSTTVVPNTNVVLKLGDVTADSAGP